MTRDNLNKHFKDRVRQRFGLKLSKKNLAHLKKNILNGNYELDYVSDDDPQRKVYKVFFRGFYMRIVFDHSNDEFVTALQYDSGKRNKILMELSENKKVDRRKVYKKLMSKFYRRRTKK